MTRKEELYKISDNLRVEFTNSINNILKNILPNWRVICLHDENLRLGFDRPGEFWDSGEPKTQDFDIYFGNRYSWNDNNEFIFEMNTCCFGSFDIETDNTPAIYFKGVGTILNNKEFQKNLKELLHTFYFKNKELRSEIYQIQKDEENEARKIREEEAKKAKDIENVENVKKLSECPNAEVVIKLYKDKSVNTGFTYRNRPADIVSFHDPSTYNAYAEARRMNKNLGSYANYSYKDVEANKIKVA